MADMDDVVDVVDVLKDILDELRGFRAEFMEFTGYNTMKVQDLADAITGPTGYNIGDLMGKLPYSIEDLHNRLGEIAGTLSLIDINTQP